MSEFFEVKYNNVVPESGKILIAEPFLNDYYFKRSIVLLIDHNDEGSFGIVLNKPMHIQFNDMVSDFPAFDAEMFLGGPVKKDSLFYLHRLGDKIDGSVKIMDGVYWGGDLSQIRELIMYKQLDSSDIRFFAGYSGWEGQQLESELQRDSWLVSDMPASMLLKSGTTDLWKSVLHKIGGKYAYWTQFPVDPNNN